MLIQKRGPEEVRVGKKATFVITVRNAGNSTAHDVTVVDSVPLGMRFSEANPQVSPNAEGILSWKLGEMPAGDERTINLQMIPERQGGYGSLHRASVFTDCGDTTQARSSDRMPTRISDR
jgi:uncharacterized repeat protein (TIGR01451 family)